jgi:hypothetical protein
MPLESNVPQEFIQEHIMKMLQYHFRICNHHAEGYELLKSEFEALKSKASAQQVQKIQKWKKRQKWKIHKTIPDGVGSMTETLIWISQKEVWRKSLVQQVLY